MEKIFRILSITLLIVSIISLSDRFGFQLQLPVKASPPPLATKQVTLTVEPKDVARVSIPVNAGNMLTGAFSVQGGIGNDINFSVEDPQGNLITNKGRVFTQWWLQGKVSTEFRSDLVCASTGSYQLVFDNSFSTFSNKVINLTVTVYPAG